MGKSEYLEAAFGRCHDAVLGLDTWDGALQSLGEQLGAESCVLKSRKSIVRNGVPLQLESSEHQAFTQVWLDHIDGAPDPHFYRPHAISTRRCPCVIEHQITTDDERKRMPYYNEIARPGGRDWWACIRFDVLGDEWVLPVYRGSKRGAFDREEALFLGRQSRHFGRLVRAAQSVERGRVDVIVGTLEDLGVAAALINRAGIIVSHNAYLDKRLGPDLTIIRGRLRVGDPRSDRSLAEFQRKALLNQSDPLVIFRDLLPWMIASILPLGTLSTQVFNGNAAILLLKDLTSNSSPAIEMLNAAYGLTPAEARLARALSDGSGLERAFESLEIKRETARSQLKTIFGKTGTRSQAELAALMNRIASAP